MISLPVALLILIGFGFLVFELAGLLSARPVPEQGKREPYFCGEKAPGVEQGVEGSAGQRPGTLHPEYRRFFATAFLFTVVEAGTLLLGTIPKDRPLWVALCFAGLMLFSVSAILVEVFRE